jgi:hypothetical protein
MNINADREVFGYVKNLMRDCQFDNIIDIYFTCPSQDEGIGSSRFCINNVDELVGKMFDLSLSKRVSAIHSFASDYCHLSAFEISLSESSDHQTNITPELLESLQNLIGQSRKTYWLKAEFVVDFGK